MRRIIISILLTLFSYTVTAPIHEAIKNGNVEELQSILEENPHMISQEYEHGMTPLHMAANNIADNSLEMVNMLLEYGADPNARSDIHNATPIHFALDGRPQANTIDIVRALLEAKASADARMDDLTPLIIAAYKGLNNVIELLLEYNANPNARASPQALLLPGSTNLTPLSAAVIQGNNSTVRMLLKRGADPHMKTNGATPRYIAQRRGFQDIARIIKQHIRREVQARAA